jgi:hypothetical protein
MTSTMTMAITEASPEGTHKGRVPTARQLAFVAILLAGAALGVGVANLASSPGPITPEAGVVVSVNGFSQTWEGAIRESDGQVVNVGFWTSGGITLHRGERISYIEVPVRDGDATITETLVVSPGVADLG